jgi:hypothetical protein
VHRRLALLGIAFSLIATSCNQPDAGQNSKIYLFRTPGPGQPAGSVEGLIPVARTFKGGDVFAAISDLLVGPTPIEREAGITSAIPVGTTLNGVEIADGILTADLSSTFDDGGGSMSMFVRLTQLVYTSTQFPDIRGVSLSIDGEPVTTFSSEGIELLSPMRRSDGFDQLPAIFIDSPAWGASVQNPLHVQGLANVFEAQFRIQILNASGDILADSAVMATCGTGCWGEYSVNIAYSIAEAQWGTIRAFEPSPKDGSPINISEYRVWLSPAEQP